jgi:N-acetyl sugar amidotransferase
LEPLPKVFQNLQLIPADEKVIFCKKCVLSNQRPRLMFNNDGICAACLYSEYKKTSIDWDKREKELEILCDKHRRDDGYWDVIVPASGGKDSTYVAYMLKEKYGMHPLTVTWSPHIYTEIGWNNLHDFIQSGYDNILATPNGQIHRKLSKITFREFGDNFLPFIYGQLNFPFQIAARYKIPLVFFGEDGDVEYGGSFERYDKPNLELDYTVKSKFTAFPPDYWKQFGFEEKDLQHYSFPDRNEFGDLKVEAHYFSYYDNWKPEKHYEIAKNFCGFKANSVRNQGTFSNFASLDDKTDGFHYYCAFIKFGIGRTTSDTAHQIRDEVLTRDEGIDLVHQFDGEFPTTYLTEFLDYMDIDMDELTQILDKFRRPLIWTKEDNLWKLRYQIKKQ